MFPLKRKTVVLNGTFYENILVTRVHPEYVFGENIININSLADFKDNFYHNKRERINDFKNYLVKNRTESFL